MLRRILFTSWGIVILLAFFLPSAQAEEHWAYKPLLRPDVPTPKSASAANSDNPIDAFVLAKLEEAGLSPSPEASPRVLLRRLFLDLTGLLPSPAELDAFETACQTNPEQARRDVIDQLLASPHFGERWGRHWLDLARYADSDGYLGDTERPWAWRYRDWVVDAVNRDQAYDQFTIEQLAGDLLPNPTPAQLIATGFNRNGLRNTEAGSDLELSRTQEVIDRVNATSTVWFALTVACAECHDHKHDAISQKEFFQIYAFFNNTEILDADSPFPDEAAEHQVALDIWGKVVAQAEKRLRAYENGPLRAQREQWEAAQSKAKTSGHWTNLTPDKAQSGAKDEMEIRKDDSIFVTGRRGVDPDTVTYTVESVVPKATRMTGIRLEAIGAYGEGCELGYGVGRGKGGEFVLSRLSAQLEVEGEKPRPIAIRSVEVDHSDSADSVDAVLDPKTNDGWRVATQTQQSHFAVFAFDDALEVPTGARLIFTFLHKKGGKTTLRHFRLAATAEDKPAAPSKMTDEVRTALALSATDRRAEQEKQILRFQQATDPKWVKLRSALEKQLIKHPAAPTTKAQTLVERRDDRRESFIHVRGDYTRQGERVYPAPLAVLHPFQPRSKTGDADRLDLAHWIVDPANPLTPRVAVNQIWQHLFGHGIVDTSDDFGIVGTPPTHPELLDWLAAEFRDNGWSRKALIRKIVESATYRQSSAIPASYAERDEEPPANDLLWRQNSFRIDAEEVRDVHLAASGLLSQKMGGPSIRPPLPGFITEVGRSVKWPVSEGEDRYRRGIYIFLKRTIFYPSLNVFDAPGAETACSRREHSNSPMQALTLLNDPVFFECAEHLGQNLAKKYGDRTEEAIVDLYRRCLGRAPDPAELDTLLTTYEDLRREADTKSALVATSRIVMNLDEFISRD